MLDHATMITADPGNRDAIVLSTTIALDNPAAAVASATLTATAHGIYEATIGGQPVSEGLFAPGWTTYEKRLQVQEYDVTGLVADGVSFEVLLGNGWWRGNLGFLGADINYGDEIGFIAELDITYADGSTQRIATGPDWTASRSTTRFNTLYDGQVIDLGATGLEALAVRATDLDRSTLVPQVKPLVVRHESVAPVRIWQSPSGKTLVDFGQNLVGWIKLRASGLKGTEITLRHAEVLENEELGTRPLRGAKATDTFILSGGDDVFEPTLTFHGFQFAEVSGFPGELTAADLEAVVVHSVMEPLGTFECSNPLVNQLIQNSIWGQRGNFLDVPTDCPQRDERMGWTGDLAAYAATSCYQFDVADILHGWLLDVQAEIDLSGFVPFVVPDLLKLIRRPDDTIGRHQAPTAVWGDAACWVPEALWWAYGDRERLATYYPGMTGHLESVEGVLSETGLWDTGFQFGDWLDPTAPPDNPIAAKANSGVVATACLYRSARFTAQVAVLLGKDGEAARWTALAERTRDAFNRHYVTDDGARIFSDAQTVYALAIHFGLLDAGATLNAGQRLSELVAENDYRVSTGFAGTPFVTWALAETGHVDDAYRMVLQTENPSWLYAVTMGATTVWERWDSMLPDGSINPGEMTSFNHYALGAMVDWLYKVVAGIRPAEPGYDRLLLQPTPGEGLDWAKGSLVTRHGTVESGWRRDGDGYVVDVVVPDGIEAEVVLPDGTRQTVGGGTHAFGSK